MKAIAQIFYGFIEPEPGGWHDEIFPAASGITTGSYGDLHFIAHNHVPILTTKSYDARLLDPSRFTIGPEVHDQLVSYVKEHNIATASKEPQWILAVEVHY